MSNMASFGIEIGSEINESFYINIHENGDSTMSDFGMSSPSGSTNGRDFVSQFKMINNKNKRRFLKKPNTVEMKEQYSSLVSRLEEDGQYEYAGYCGLSVAKCDQILHDKRSEIESILQAGKLFLDAETRTFQMHCPSFGENIHAAIGCYNKAITLNMEIKDTQSAGGLCIQLGRELKKLELFKQAETQFTRAVIISKDFPIQQLTAKEDLALCKLDLKDYDGALNLYLDIRNAVKEHISGGFGDTYKKSEISIILLLMMLQPGPNKLTAETTAILEPYLKYDSSSEEDNDPGPPIGASQFERLRYYNFTNIKKPDIKKINNPIFLPQNFELFCNLRSIIISCESNNIPSLIYTENKMLKFLSEEQQILFRKLINIRRESEFITPLFPQYKVQTPDSL